MKIVLIGDDQCIVNFFIKLRVLHDVVAVISTKRYVVDTLKKFKRNLKTYLLEEMTTVSKRIKLEKSMLPGLPHCDLMITAVFQYILPDWMISVPKYGSINTHYSLLPKYRGKNPITNVLVNEEKLTGVTFHFMVTEFDKGNIVEQLSFDITKDDNEETILEKSTTVAKNNIVSVVEKAAKIYNGTVTALKQSDTKVEPSYCSTQLHIIDWTKPTSYVDKVIKMTRVVSLNYFVYQDKKYHILTHDVQFDTEKGDQCVVPGTVVEDGSKFKVKTSDGYILAKRCKVLPKIQRE